MAAIRQVEPELHYVKPTPHVPNSILPIIVYRSVLDDTLPENILKTIEPQKWIKGGQWKAYPVPHFHSICHECYGVIQGENTYSLGKGPRDTDDCGIKLKVQKGDVFVFPAGVSHASIDSKGEYEYVGLYPERNERSEDGEAFDMHYCDATPDETKKLAARCAQTPVPDLDPLYGRDGPLPRIWKDALVQASSS
ncbi:hypothetical protein B0J14DRAFT_106948 [Halenospora varia]|nr:hypothetical protein B0J14DRAFT_106948 [Halenospora varia]